MPIRPVRLFGDPVLTTPADEQAAHMSLRIHGSVHGSVGDVTSVR